VHAVTDVRGTRLERAHQRGLVQVSVGCAVLAFCGTAFCHDPLKAYGVVWSDADADSFVVRTNRGLIFKSEGGAQLLCHAGVGAYESERLPVVPARGGWLVGTSDGIVHTDASGCPDEAAPRTNLGAIQDFKRHPSHPELLFAVTADASVGSALIKSNDSGETFVAVAEPPAEAFFNSIALDASSGDRAFLAGAGLDPTTGQVLHFTAQWQAGTALDWHPVALDPTETQLRVLEVTPGETTVLAHTVVGSNPMQQPERLLFSDDEARSWQLWFSAPGLDGVYVDGDTTWLASIEGLFRAEAVGPFEALELARSPSCVGEHDGELLWCDSLGVRASDDGGVTSRTLLAFQDVQLPVSCDDSGQALEVCCEAWSHFVSERDQLLVPPSPADQQPPNRTGSHTCSAVSAPLGGSLGWLCLSGLMVLAALLRAMSRRLHRLLSGQPRLGIRRAAPPS
jgi:hypothetical protein